MFQFLHAADLHLDSPLRGLQRYEGAPVEAIREASRHALINLVDLALNEKVAFVLIAGDLYDGDWKDYNTGLFFVKQMARLRDAKIPVFAITGNHDAANKMTRDLPLPDNVTMLATGQPQTVELADFGVAIHGQGFAQAKITEDLSQRYPHRQDGCFNIGLLHTCATGADGHERYAPCTVEGLRSKNYDYWALGHIHKRDILCKDPLIVFPGNLQGRHIRETGPKGGMLVRVDHRGAPRAEFRSLDVMRWELCAIHADEKSDGDDLAEAALDKLRRLWDEHQLPLAVRVRVTGRTAAHARLTSDSARWKNELRARVLADFPDKVWIESVDWQTRPPAEEIAAEGPFAELAAVLTDLRSCDEVWHAFLRQCADFEPLERKVKKYLDCEGSQSFCDPAQLRNLLDQVESVLKQRLRTRDGNG